MYIHRYTYVYVDILYEYIQKLLQIYNNKTQWGKCSLFKKQGWQNWTDTAKNGIGTLFSHHVPK